MRNETQELPIVRVLRPEFDDLPKVRRAMITKAHVDKFGPTPGCTKCRNIMNQDVSSPALGHNQECRERMEDLLSKDPLLAKHIEKARLREDEYLARQVEVGDTRGKSEEFQSGPGGIQMSVSHPAQTKIWMVSP